MAPLLVLGGLLRRPAVLMMVVVPALLGLAQLLLPGIAAQRLRDRLSQSGRVVSVDVEAFPAIELLWHHADRVTVRMASLRSRPGRLGSLLDQASGVGRLEVSIGRLDSGLLILHRATLVKQGSGLAAEATISEADLRASVPLLQNVSPVASSNGALVLRGTGGLLGAALSIDATLAVRDGALILAPDVPFGSLASLTLFENPHVLIQTISAAAVSGGFTVAARASLG